MTCSSQISPITNQVNQLVYAPSNIIPISNSNSDKEKNLINYMLQVKKIDENSQEAFIAQYGKFNVPQKKPAEIKRGKARECFSNAYQLALFHPELSYVEGFAYPDMADIPIHHAWCIDADNLVIDNTWPKSGTCYYGVTFSLDFINEIIASTKRYGVLLPRHPIFKKHYPLPTTK